MSRAWGPSPDGFEWMLELLEAGVHIRIGAHCSWLGKGEQGHDVALRVLEVRDGAELTTCCRHDHAATALLHQLERSIDEVLRNRATSERRKREPHLTAGR